MSNTVRIAMIGTGNIGGTLGRRLHEAGYNVVFGARDATAAAAKLQNVDAPVLSLADAVRGAGVVFLTVPAAAAVSAAVGLALAPGTILVDCTNPLKWDGGPVWAPPPEGSVTAALTAALPDVRVVKAFNHFGAEIHGDPQVGGEKADAFVAGADAEARATVMALAEALGFRAQDGGPLRNAALLENLTILWLHLAHSGTGRHFAFKAVGR